MPFQEFVSAVTSKYHMYLGDLDYSKMLDLKRKHQYVQGSRQEVAGIVYSCPDKPCKIYCVKRGKNIVRRTYFAVFD